MVYGEVIKTDKAIIRVGEVIPNTPASQYNHDPTNGFVYGDKVVELDGTEIQLLIPLCSRHTRKIDEVDKDNLVTDLKKNTYDIKIETSEQKSVQSEMDIHGYVAKLHHDCGHAPPEKMIDTLMREGFSDYSLGVATEYLTFKESVVEPRLKTGCKRCEEQNHKEPEADAEARTETPVPEKERENPEKKSTGEPTAVYHIT